MISILSILLSILTLTSILIPVYALSYQGANISDSTYRYAAIENEDLSFSVYRTLNGTTERVYPGFDNSTELLDVLNNQKTQQELTQELQQTNSVMSQLIASIKQLTQTLLQQAAAQFLIPNVYASTSGVEITPPPKGSADSENVSTINFTATFVNGTKAVVHNQNITETQSNMLVQILSGLIAGKELGELQDLQDLEDFEEEQQQQEEESSADDGGSGGGGGSGDFDPNAPIELMPPEGPGLNPEPEPPEEGGNGSGGGSDDEGSESES